MYMQPFASPLYSIPVYIILDRYICSTLYPVPGTTGGTSAKRLPVFLRDDYRPIYQYVKRNNPTYQSSYIRNGTRDCTWYTVPSIGMEAVIVTVDAMVHTVLASAFLER